VGKLTIRLIGRPDVSVVLTAEIVQEQRCETLSPSGTKTTVVDFALLAFTANDSTNFNMLVILICVTVT
jgi:hypothetical protein